MAWAAVLHEGTLPGLRQMPMPLPCGPVAEAVGSLQFLKQDTEFIPLCTASQPGFVGVLFEDGGTARLAPRLSRISASLHCFDFICLCKALYHGFVEAPIHHLVLHALVDGEALSCIELHKIIGLALPHGKASERRWPWRLPATLLEV
eukprot:g32627.t1